MNRRTFIKTMSAGISLPVIFKNAFKDDIKSTKSQWISFEDQIPEKTDKFEIRNNKSGKIKKGEILEFDSRNKGLAIDIDKKEYKLYAKRMFAAHRISDNCLEVIDKKDWDWRYV